MKLKIGYNSAEATAFTKNVEEKGALFKEAIDFTSKYVSINDLDAFATDMVNYFTEQWKQIHSKDFSSLMSVKMQMQSVGCNVEILRTIQDKFNSIPIEINLSTGEALNTPDFSVYISDKAKIEKYKALEDVIEAIDKLKDHDVHVYAMPIQSGCNNAIVFDFHSQQLKVNLATL